jgi:ketosteroid isomerase-like protein
MPTKTCLCLLAAAALLPVLAACQKPAPAADPAKETAAINAQIDAYNRATKARDAEKAVAIDAPDVRGYGGGAPDVNGKDEDLRVNKAIMADPAYAFQLTPEHTEVAKSGDIAFQTGTWKASFVNPKTKAVETDVGHWGAGWRKDAGGVWRLASFTLASPAPAAPAVSSDPHKQ